MPAPDEDVLAGTAFQVIVPGTSHQSIPARAPDDHVIPRGAVDIVATVIAVQCVTGIGPEHYRLVRIIGSVPEKAPPQFIYNRKGKLIRPDLIIRCTGYSSVGVIEFMESCLDEVASTALCITDREDDQCVSIWHTTSLGFSLM
jgi:hypothetical protein